MKRGAQTTNKIGHKRKSQSLASDMLESLGIVWWLGCSLSLSAVQYEAPNATEQ
ncbi:hypothetical protein ACVIU7_004130 [Bradyrhizobium liaoningense]